MKEFLSWEKVQRLHSRVTPLQFVISGAVLYHLGLYSLSTRNPFPTSLIIAGIFVQAFGTSVFVSQLLLKKGPGPASSLLFLLVLSVSTSFTRLSRFAGFSGFDFLREVQVLENTARTGYWDPNLSASLNYQSSIAITILPTISSRLLELPADTVLLFQTFMLTALLPLTVHAAITSHTGDFRLGILTGILFAQNWFFFGAHVIAKSAPALLLFTLALYCLTRSERNLRSIGVLLSLGVAMAHYTIAFLLLFALLTLVVWSKAIGRGITRILWFRGAITLRVGLVHIVAAVGLVTLWIAYVAPSTLLDVGVAAEQLLSSAGNLLAGPRRADTSLAITNSTGPIVTGWFNFQNALIGLGALFWLNEYRKGRLKGSFGNWLLSGIFLTALVISWIALPWLSLRVESTRILAMILPVVIVFMATILTEVFRRPRAWKALALVIVFLMLPMNLMLASQERNILYYQLDQLSVTRRLSLESISLPFESNGAVAVWAGSYLPSDKPIEVDAVGRYALITSSPLPVEIAFVHGSSPPYDANRYTILSSYFVQEDIWSTATLGARTFTTADPAPFFSPTHDIIYSSSRFWIAGPRE